jgi:Rhodopirellula transposase DDE domain
MKSFFFCWNFLPHLNPLEIRRNPIRYRRGDPESALRWTCKSVRKLAQELGRGGHRVSQQIIWVCT